MRNWIDKNWVQKATPTSGDKIHAYPIIIDDLLNESAITSRKLKINLVEEILSRCAYRTYIFLDTMSTSYEFGEFTNYAYGQHAVRVFVDKEYDSRVNCPLGSYLKLSTGNGLNTYTANYNGRGHLFFPDDKVPDEIIHVIGQDSPLLPGFQKDYPIHFAQAGTAETSSFGHFAFRQVPQMGYEFIADPKTWFYFMSFVQSGHAYIDLGSISSPTDFSFLKFMKYVRQEVATSFSCLEKTLDKPGLFTETGSIKLTCPVFGDEFFYHAAALLGLIKDCSSASPTGVSYVSQQPVEPGRASVEGMSFFFPSFKRLYRDLEKSGDTIRNGIVSKTLTIKSKKRNIVCYAPNKYGRDLRNIHETILSRFLSILPTSAHSFAYKEGQNTLSCLRQHEGNIYFAKFDISKYFESITQQAVIKKILALTRQTREDKGPSASNRVCRISLDIIGSEVKAILRPLFFFKHSKGEGVAIYKNYLPIGYVSSPKLSDFYLRDLDEKMGSISGLTYTRYADDILLSANDQSILEAACELLRQLIKNEGLSINEKKVLKKGLLHVNDSIHFLGLNLVRREEGYSYTVSQSYLIETSKLIEKTLHKKNAAFTLKISGRVEYIKYVSLESFEKLKRIVLKKLGFLPPIIK